MPEGHRLGNRKAAEIPVASHDPLGGLLFSDDGDDDSLRAH